MNFEAFRERITHGDTTWLDEHAVDFRVLKSFSKDFDKSLSLSGNRMNAARCTYTSIVVIFFMDHIRKSAIFRTEKAYTKIELR